MDRACVEPVASARNSRETTHGGFEGLARIRVIIKRRSPFESNHKPSPTTIRPRRRPQTTLEMRGYFQTSGQLNIFFFASGSGRMFMRELAAPSLGPRLQNFGCHVYSCPFGIWINFYINLLGCKMLETYLLLYLKHPRLNWILHCDWTGNERWSNEGTASQGDCMMHDPSTKRRKGGGSAKLARPWRDSLISERNLLSSAMLHQRWCHPAAVSQGASGEFFSNQAS